MKSTSFFISLLALLFLSNCGKNDIQLPEKELSGMVNGKEWSMKFTNAFLHSSDLKYRVKFLSENESGSDPCAVPSTANEHVSIILQLKLGSSSLPLPIVEESARFHWADGNSAIATSGFLEIFDIRNSRVFGYLQAQLDDENSIEGSFQAVICN